MNAVQGRPRWQRVAALLLSLWFVALASDLPGLHACAVHGAAHAAAMMASPSAMAGAAQDHAGAHAPGTVQSDCAAMGAPAANGHDHGTPPTDGTRGCTCLGACCAALGALPAPAPPTFVVAAIEPERVVVPGRPAHEYMAAWTDFVLPFSTAPPARGRA